MKKWKRCFCAVLCLCLLSLFACKRADDPDADASTTAGESSSAAEADDGNYLVRYKGELYTSKLNGKDLGLFGFDTCKKLSDKKHKAMTVYENNPDEEMVSVYVKEYEDDPECNFLLECGTIFGDRLMHKTSYEIPDYRDADSKVTRIVWSSEWSDDRNYSPENLIVWDDPQIVSTFMQYVRETAADPAAAESKPADRSKSTGKICFLEFEGVDGRLSIGYMAPSTDGSRCMYFSDFPQERTYDDTYAVVPMPDSLQSYERG